MQFSFSDDDLIMIKLKKGLFNIISYASSLKNKEQVWSELLHLKFRTEISNNFNLITAEASVNMGMRVHTARMVAWWEEGHNCYC